MSLPDVASLAVLGGARALARRHVPSTCPKRETTCWLYEHALVNVVITCLAAPGLVATWRAPLVSLDARVYVDPLPLRLALWLHVYHVVFYALTWADALHHGVFVTLLAAPGAYYAWGNLANAQLFFMCGLPGALLYALVVAQRLGRWRSVREPTVTALVNVGLRAPGILFCTCTFLRVLWTRHAPQPHAPAWAVAMQVSLAPLNAIYYSVTSVRRARRA